MIRFLGDNSFEAGVFAGASCAFGVFDGLHRGHRYQIDCALETARDIRRSMVITFDIDPDEVFHPERLEKLMSNEERISALASSGVDDVVVLPFVPALYTLEPDEFLQKTFSEGAPAHLHVGNDFRFGAKAAGTVVDLKKWAEKTGCEVHAHHLVSEGGRPITSTRIRKLVADGRFSEADELAGRPWWTAGGSGMMQEGKRSRFNAGESG